MELNHLKCLYGDSNVYFDAQLKLIKKALLKDNVLPNFSYKVIPFFGVGFQ